MKTVNLQLVLNVKYKPSGQSISQLRDGLTRMVNNGMSNGVLTGDSPATVETYNFKIAVPKKKGKRIRRKRGEHRWSDATGVDRCVTCDCDGDDAHVGGIECTYGQPEGFVQEK